MRIPELNPRQEEAVLHDDGPLLIVAGAGSGKTRTLTSRLIALLERGTPPSSVIAITFTNKAADEMGERVASFLANTARPFIGTFHSLGAKILREEMPLFDRTKAFSIFDADDSLSLLKRTVREFDSRKTLNPLALRSAFSHIKNEFLDPGAALSELETEIFREYETALAQNNAFDFDDLIEKVVVLLRRNPELLRKYRQRFRHVLVDEFQDVNPSQYAMLKLLAEEHRNLNVVGDDAQSIYGFRGSDFRTFLNFERDWPEVKVVLLEQNYRSTKTIVRAASALIKQNKTQRPKELWTENPEGDPLRVTRFRNAEEEGEWIANLLAEETPRGENPESAVLYRTNAQSRAVEQALIFAEIPYRIFGGVAFYERKEIKDVVAALRVTANPRDEVSRERIFKTFPSKIHKPLLQLLLDEKMKTETPIELIARFLAETEYFDYLRRHYPNAEERAENVNELISFAGGFSSLQELLERITLLQSSDMPQNGRAGGETRRPLSLMTIHLAKGLEFDRVFLVGCDEGLLPHQRSYGTLEELEEERRLMYVALTRARREVTLSFSKIPSRFLYELPPELTVFLDERGVRNSLPDEDERFIE